MHCQRPKVGSTSNAGETKVPIQGPGRAPPTPWRWREGPEVPGRACLFPVSAILLSGNSEDPKVCARLSLPPHPRSFFSSLPC